MKMEFLFDFSPVTWLVAAVIASITYYWYYSRENHYWKVRNIPADIPTSFGLFALPFMKKVPTLFEQDEKQYKKYGRLCGVYFFRIPMLLISDPELLRDIFVKDFHSFPDRRAMPSDKLAGKMLSALNGEEWKKMRTLMSPVFSSGKIRKLAILVNRSSEAVANSLVKLADGSTGVELKRLFGAFTLDVIASTAFGTDLNSIENPDNIFVTHAKTFFAFTLNWRILMFVITPGLMNKWKIPVFNPKGLNFFNDLIREIRNQRKRDGEKREDFLQMMMDAESENPDDDHENANTNSEMKNTTEKTTKKTLSTDELVAQCILFFLAGYDTTATTISLVCYNLALKPEFQEKLLKEIDETWEKHGKFDFDVVSGMKYLDAVVSESLRLYPPATRIERKCVEDYELGDTGITIPKGMYVGVPVYAMHRDPEFFPDPDTFNPDRFLPENKDSIQPYTYLPFGAGPRVCIAIRFALMEVKLCLANVLRHVSFRSCSQTKVPIEYQNGAGLIQPTDVTVQVVKRDH